MNTSVIKITDGGKYNNEIIKIAIKRNWDGDVVAELILIQYGPIKELKPCSVYYFSNEPNKIYLSAAGTGQYKDISLGGDIWLNILKKLKSEEQLNRWKGILNKEKSVA